MCVCVTSGGFCDKNVFCLTVAERDYTQTHSPRMLFSFASYLFIAVTFSYHGIVQRFSPLHIVMLMHYPVSSCKLMLCYANVAIRGEVGGGGHQKNI